MAVTFECDYCGEAIYRENEWVNLRSEERGEHMSDRALNRMGLGELGDRLKGQFHFHLRCFKQAVEMIDNHRRWAAGEEGTEAAGLEWELVERNWRRHRRNPPVLEPRYENRIMDLCRERGINRDELAEALGTSRGAVGRWLRCYVTANGRPMGITAKWVKQLQMFFDLDSRDELFASEPTGDAPADEFVKRGY